MFDEKNNIPKNISTWAPNSILVHVFYYILEYK
jgi:hypothetical protein